MQKTGIINHNGLIYQPIPFEEYKDTKVQRIDCEERYKIIKDNYGDFKNKTLIDICCANGYFMFKFMQDGGLIARGIDIKIENVKFINGLAFEKKIDVICDNSLNRFKDNDFDIGIYLDTHYAEGTEKYLEYLKNHTKILFTSCVHRENHESFGKTNIEYEKLLSEVYGKPLVNIYQGFMERIIFKCA